MAGDDGRMSRRGFLTGWLRNLREAAESPPVRPKGSPWPVEAAGEPPPFLRPPGALTTP